jgi:hypothetical protein
MLDQVDEESLDLVDEVIFDGGACKRVRQEALAFMMDHTEGFEVMSMKSCRETSVITFLTPFQSNLYDFLLILSNPLQYSFSYLHVILYVCLFLSQIFPVRLPSHSHPMHSIPRIIIPEASTSSTP